MAVERLDLPPGVPPLLLVVGPTASGKSRLGLELAEAIGGEIVSADAFAVYRGLDIGTDKPDGEARRRVRHHLVDILDPWERFSAGAFAVAADAAIADIHRRGRVPVVVGGTHFYIRALLIGLFPTPAPDDALRRRLARSWQEDPSACFARLAAADPVAAARIGESDRQRVLRALEIIESSGTPPSTLADRHPQTPRYRALLLAPRRSRDDLYARINLRVDSMFEAGLAAEVAAVLAAGVDPQAHALKAIGYREVVDHFQGRCSLDEAIVATKSASRRFAKRQLSWLRTLREGPVIWIPPVEDGGVEEAIAKWTEFNQGNEGP